MDTPTGYTSAHDLLLALAGLIDDDLLGWARELIAIGEETRAIALLTSSITAERTALPPAVKAALVGAGVAVRVDVDAAALAAPAGPEIPHRFAAAPAGVPDVARAVAGLPPRQLQGTTVHLTWRLTPAGTAPGPLPHPLVLVEVDPRRHAAEMLAYQLAAGLDRAGVIASVEVLAAGVPRSAYHAAALLSAVPVVIGESRAEAGPEAQVSSFDSAFGSVADSVSDSGSGSGSGPDPRLDAGLGSSADPASGSDPGLDSRSDAGLGSDSAFDSASDSASGSGVGDRGVTTTSAASIPAEEPRTDAAAGGPSMARDDHVTDEPETFPAVEDREPDEQGITIAKNIALPTSNGLDPAEPHPLAGPVAGQPRQPRHAPRRVLRRADETPALAALSDPLSAPLDQPLLAPLLDPTIHAHDPLGVDHLVKPRLGEHRTSEPQSSEPQSREPQRSRPLLAEPREPEPELSEPQPGEPRLAESRLRRSADLEEPQATSGPRSGGPGPRGPQLDEPRPAEPQPQLGEPAPRTPSYREEPPASPQPRREAEAEPEPQPSTWVATEPTIVEDSWAAEWASGAWAMSGDPAQDRAADSAGDRPGDHAERRDQPEEPEQDAADQPARLSDADRALLTRLQADLAQSRGPRRAAMPGRGSNGHGGPADH